MNTEYSPDLSPKEYREEAMLRIAWRSSILLALVFLFLIFYVKNDVNSITSYIFTLVSLIMGMIYMYVKKKSRPIYIFYAIAGCFITQLSCWTIPETNHYSDFMWICICSFVGFWGGKKAFGISLITLNIIGIGYFVFYHYNNHVEILLPLTDGQLLSTFIELAVAFIILAYLLFQFTNFQEVWERAYETSHKELQEQNQTVNKQNDENIILLKEIHHRVKNNLQIIVSLLRLQKDELQSDESKRQFQEAINRVMVMSSIHQKLYQQKDLININLAQHLDELITELKMLFKNHRKIEIDISCDFTFIGLKTMVPVGLLINELVSNSFKYAFKNRDSGEIHIRIYEHETGFNIDYSDNGQWNVKEEGAAGFGLELIEVFTNQLNGERNFETNEEGTAYSFQLQFLEE